MKNWFQLGNGIADCDLVSDAGKLAGLNPVGHLAKFILSLISSAFLLQIIGGNGENRDILARILASNCGMHTGPSRTSLPCIDYSPCLISVFP